MNGELGKLFHLLAGRKYDVEEIGMLLGMFLQGSPQKGVG